MQWIFNSVLNGVQPWHIPHLSDECAAVFLWITNSSVLFTALSDITGVTVTRFQRELTISWNKLNNRDIYNYTLQRQREMSEENFTGSAEGDVITHTYLSLTPGTEHSFILFTVVNNVKSTGYSFKSITSKFW